MKKTEAKLIAHTLSKTSKMPGASYSLPAAECKKGSELAKIPGTVCHKCYARRGAYAWKPTQAALYKRLATIDHPHWVEAMATLVEGQDYFRWHDSGDLQSVDHLDRIVRVARLTPRTEHWLPTKEFTMVRDFITNNGVIPPNLTIRLSAHKVDSAPLKMEEFRDHGVVSCRSISRDAADTYEANGLPGICPARHQNGKCGDCRQCWDRTVPDVAYPMH